MIRFVVKECYTGHVIHAGGITETRIVTFDGDQEGLERFLRFEDQPEGERSDYLVRDLVGVELLSA